MQTVETGRNAAVTCQYPRACGPPALKEWVCAEGPKGSTAVAAQRARAAPLAHAQSGRSEQRSACLSAGLRRRGTGNSKCVTGRGFVAVSVDPLDTGSSLHCSGTTPSHNPLHHLPRHWTLRSAGPLADAESVRIAAPHYSAIPLQSRTTTSLGHRLSLGIRGRAGAHWETPARTPGHVRTHKKSAGTGQRPSAAISPPVQEGVPQGCIGRGGGTPLPSRAPSRCPARITTLYPPPPQHTHRSVCPSHTSRNRQEPLCRNVPGLAPGMHYKGRDLRGGPRGGWTGGWRRLPKRFLSVTNAVKAGTCRQGDTDAVSHVTRREGPP